MPGVSAQWRSLDSVQQAVFFTPVAGKKSTVMIDDTNGKVGQDEHRIQVAGDMAEVTFLSGPYSPETRKRDPELFCLARVPIWSCALYSSLNPEQSIAVVPLHSKF